MFGSEAKAILAVPGIPTELDPQALASYLELGYVAAPQSMFKGIRKLPPATILIAENGGVTERRYWRVPDRVDRSLDEAAWIAQVREGIERAVHLQMVSDVPIGAFLSGGVDSSAVVAFMAAHSDRPVKTYAIGFDGGDAEAYYNELPWARRVATLFGTDHHEILVRPDVVSLLPRLLWHMDEPIADSAFVTTYLVSEFAQARRHGHPVGGGGRRALRRLPALPRQPLPAAVRAPPCRPAPRDGRAGCEAAQRPAFAAAQHPAAGQGFPRQRGPAAGRALPLVRRGVR